jgi:hypothetical protein
MPQDLFLIQGVFFQNRSWLDLGMKPGEGVVAMVCNGMCDFIFSGVLEYLPDGALRGVVYDVLGEAELSDIALSESELRFTKKYAQRIYLIQYKFTKQEDGTWIGEYTGSETGSGKSRCVLIKISQDFFTPPGS